MLTPIDINFEPPVACKEHAEYASVLAAITASRTKQERLWLDGFLEACQKRLPTKAAIERDKNRKKGIK